MEKSLILFLSVFLAGHFSYSQQTKCDCTDKKVQDSLVEKYIERGAYKYSYNSPVWQVYCDSAIAICPNIAVAYQHKAIPYIKGGDYARAYPLEDKAVELDPKYYTAYRGFLKCIFSKDYEGAIIDFKKAQQLTPGSYEMDHTYSFYEGLCNLELGRYSLAEQNFMKDVSIQTGGDTAKKYNAHFNTLLYIGILKYEMKKNVSAKEYLLKSLAAYKQSPDANYYLAMVYAREKNIRLKNKYLQIAKQSKTQGYGLNEDNVYYAYYPHQVTLYEIENELQH